MKEPGKEEVKRLRRTLKTSHKITASLQLTVLFCSDSISSVPSAASAAVSWPQKLLIVVLTACSQTGHYSPQPSTERFYVGGSV